MIPAYNSMMQTKPAVEVRTWISILNHLDYTQISPVNKNYDGPRAPYGDPYHAYWVTDISKLNDRFGTAGDLKECPKRSMTGRCSSWLI